MTRTELPIDAVLPDIVSALQRSPALVLEAPPGAGKTTRVPGALLDAGFAARGEILVAEPRRLAARLAALRVASERAERVGESIGYSVRFEEVKSARTRLSYVTEGILLRRLLGAPRLPGVSTVILDEFHERQLATDLVLALIAELQRGPRPDLKLVVMSATLNAEAVARYLGDCPRIRSEGRMFPVEIEHLPAPDERPLEKQVASAVRRALSADPAGDVLVFLPGAGEIRRSREALDALAASADFLLLPLHGELPLEDQVRAVEPGPRRKVVLATNVAETSITIDGITAVVDSGLSRVAEHSPWTGLSRLRLGKISRASAAQRAGRAGRTRPGRVLRLYTRGDHDTRREQDLPEIRRADLSEAWLMLHGAGFTSADRLSWLDPPDPAALGSAESLLTRLGALDAKGTITEIGRRMLDFPLHPRLARLVVEGERRGVATEACLFAALLGERDIRLEHRRSNRELAASRTSSGPSDLLELRDRFEEARAERFAESRLRWLELDSRTVRAVDKARKQLERITRRGAPEPHSEAELESALGYCVLSAFPDRVARRRRRGERELVLVNGTTARLADTSVVHDATLLVALDVDEHERSAGRSSALVRLASAIEPEWLLELCAEALTEVDELSWNAELGRVERITRMALGSVVIDESRSPAKPGAEAARVLARAALERSNNDQLASLDAVLARLRFLSASLPELRLPEGDRELRETALSRAAEGKTTLAELRGVDLAAEYLSRLEPGTRRALYEHAPERVALPGGRSVLVHYEPDKPPWIESRLQDFFGMRETPRVAQGRVPLTLHLLAPNQRAVQVTSDLQGFWERHYAALRRELMRRYPRHAWPEDPLTAKPPEPHRRR